MKVVVLGATGNVGTSVVEALAADPHYGDRRGSPADPSSWHPAKTRFEAADVRSAELRNIYGALTLVLLTWAFQPTHRPLETWDINVLGSMNALQAAADAGVGTVVYASSLAAYSPGPGRHVDESWPTHSMPTLPTAGRRLTWSAISTPELRHPEIRVVRLYTVSSSSGRRPANNGESSPGRWSRGRCSVQAACRSSRSPLAYGSKPCTARTLARRTGWPC